MNKILTIGNFPITRGYGATIQFKNISRGFIELGCECTHICDFPGGCRKNESDATSVSSEKINIIEVYPAGIDFPANRYWRKILHIIFRLPMWIKVFCNIRKSKCDTIILFGCYPFLSLLMRIFTSKPLYCLKGEYPLYGQKIRWHNALSFFIERQLGYRCIDGMFVMTNNLKNYYSQISSSKCRFMLMPIIVDSGKFKKTDADSEDSSCITYCGDFGGNKDGVCNLLEAFIMIAEKFPEIKLKLIGSTTEEHTLKRLADMTEKAGVADRVIFTGQLPHESVVQHLKRSCVLALARPANKQAEGGFPSKVGEYLATGNPVVVTAVGEIPLYLKDMVNAFLVEPDNNAAFAEKLSYVLSHKEVAEKIGAAGKIMAEKLFDYKSLTRKMLDFMDGADD